MNVGARARRELRAIRRRARRARHWSERAIGDAAAWKRGERDRRVPPRRYGLPSFLPRVLDRTVAAVILDAGGLQRDERMLDIGCGPGQVAFRIAPHLGGGSYEGFDISKRAIDWCQERIAPTDPRLHFTLVDVGNDLYNPSGATDATDFRFPYPDDHFDLAFAGSVFTHLEPRESLHYLAETRRVLRPGGRIVATWFLLNVESEGLLARDGTLTLDHELTDADGWKYRTSHPNLPEQRIALAESDARGFHEAAGLEIYEVRYGHWCGREHDSGRLGQDMIAART